MVIPQQHRNCSFSIIYPVEIDISEFSLGHTINFPKVNGITAHLRKVSPQRSGFSSPRQCFFFFSRFCHHSPHNGGGGSTTAICLSGNNAWVTYQYLLIFALKTIVVIWVTWPFKAKCWAQLLHVINAHFYHCPLIHAPACVLSHCVKGYVILLMLYERVSKQNSSKTSYLYGKKKSICHINNGSEDCM